MVLESSLLRHERRCISNIRAPSRQRACLFCTRQKVKCDLQRPRCGRCAGRALSCEFPLDSSKNTEAPGKERDVDGGTNQGAGSYESSDASESLPYSVGSESIAAAPSTLSQTTPSMSPVPTMTQAGSAADYPDTSNFSASLDCLERRRALLHGEPSNVPPGVAYEQTMQFILRTAKSWLRVLAVYGEEGLPPFMHPIQLETGVPGAIANCITLAKMWDGHAEGSTAIVRSTLEQEIRRLIREVRARRPVISHNCYFWCLL
jgi:hypothetical protein